MITTIFFMFTVVGFLYFLHMCAYTIGGNLYDIGHYRRNAKRATKRLAPYRPLVSLLIPAYNEELVIERCLTSVVKSRYRQLEVIVIDDGSQDRTAQLVRRFQAKHPHRLIRLVSRGNHGKAESLNYALKRWAQGQLIMTLDADSMIAPHTVSHAVAYFRDQRIAGIAANVRIIEDRSVLNLLQLFEYMVAYRGKKFYSVTNAEFIIGGVGSMYRTNVLQTFGYYDTLSVTEDIGLSMKIAASGNRQSRLLYASDVVAYTESVPDFRGLLLQRFRWKYGNLQNLLRYSVQFFRNARSQSPTLLFYRLPMAYLSELLLLLEPLFMGYVLYLSWVSGSPLIFVSAYIALVIYCLLVLWSDEHYSAVQKRYLTIYVPSLYFLFYIMSLVQIIAVIRCLIALPKIISSSTSDNRWISPERTGKQVVSLSPKARENAYAVKA